MCRNKVLKMFIKTHAYFLLELLLIPLKLIVLILVPIGCFIIALVSTKNVKNALKIMDENMWKSAYETMNQTENFVHQWYRM